MQILVKFAIFIDAKGEFKGVEMRSRPVGLYKNEPHTGKYNYS